MVGLMDLGEVAWEIEQVLNKWLEQQRPTTPALLDLVQEASGAFAGWVAQLRDGNLQGEITGTGIVEQARRLKTEEAPAAAPVVVPAPVAEPGPEPGVFREVSRRYPVAEGLHVPWEQPDRRLPPLPPASFGCRNGSASFSPD